MTVLRLGTRGSKLALAQANSLIELVSRPGGPAIEIEIVATSGDRSRDPTFGDGVFVKEIQQALLEGRVDAAVHSLKDVPTEPTEGLVAVAVTPREDPREALVGGTLLDLAVGARVGTGSPRRTAQLRRLRKDLEVVPIKGNVPTRVEKVKKGEVDAVVLAMAGLNRLGMGADQVFEIDEMLPAPGQGALLVEMRDGDPNQSVFRPAHDQTVRECVVAERHVLRRLGGGCLLPLAAFARIEDGLLVLDASVTSDDGSVYIHASASGPIDKPLAVAKKAARELIEKGVREIL